MNLFIDTSNQYIIFALFDTDVITSKIIETNRNQSEIFVSEFDAFLLENSQRLEDISSFFFAQGPGSFTGIRVGLSFAKALRTSGYRNVYTINSLYLLLDNYQDSQAVIDARGHKSYYLQVVAGDFKKAELLDNEKIKNLEEINSYDKQLYQITSNVVKLVQLNKYQTELNSLYIKEPF